MDAKKGHQRFTGWDVTIYDWTASQNKSLLKWPAEFGDWDFLTTSLAEEWN